MLFRSFRLWMLVAACALAVIILLAFLNRKHRQKKTKRIERKTASVTEKPKVKPNLEIANLQGLGKREEQQDAFGASLLKNYEENGLLAVLCDGMGGMAEGGMIAGYVVSELLRIFPWQDCSLSLIHIWYISPPCAKSSGSPWVTTPSATVSARAI